MKLGVLKNLAKFTPKFMFDRLFLVLVRIVLVYPAANLLVICKVDCKSVYKVLTLSN